jgi:hypothetical protein
VVALGLILAAVYWEILRDLGRQWWDDANYSHGFIVPVFSGYLIWRERDRLRALVPRGAAWGLLVLLGGIGGLVLGDLGAENFLSRSSLIVILMGLVLFILGAEAFRLTFFPLAYLFFMVPVPAILFYAVTFPLQQLAAGQAAWALDVLGVPVLLDLAQRVADARLRAGDRPDHDPGQCRAGGCNGPDCQWFGVAYASGFIHELAGWIIYLFVFLCLIGLHLLIGWVGRTRHRPA